MRRKALALHWPVERATNAGLRVRVDPERHEPPGGRAPEAILRDVRPPTGLVRLVDPHRFAGHAADPRGLRDRFSDEEGSAPNEREEHLWPAQREHEHRHS